MDYKKLVRIERCEINEDLEIVGFILKQSDELMLLQYCADCHLNGLGVYAQKDITLIEQVGTHLFQTQIVQDMGRYDQVAFDIDYDIRSWRTFFESSCRDYTYFRVEEEREDYCQSFGKIEKLKKNHLKMHEFMGTSRWLDDLTKLYYKDISCVEVDTRYINAYGDYFKRATKKK